MDIKKEFVQVYGYCVEDGVAGVFEIFGPTVHIRLSDVRRVTIYTSFQQLCIDGLLQIKSIRRVFVRVWRDDAWG